MVSLTCAPMSPQTKQATSHASTAKSRYMLYIPTDSECSQLVKTQASRSELERIISQSSVLKRPDGSRRRLKRFYLIDNYQDNATVKRHDVASLHASIHSGSSGNSAHEYNTYSSCSIGESAGSRSESVMSMRKLDSVAGKHLVAPKVRLSDSMQRSITIKSKLNPLASVFCPSPSFSSPVLQTQDSPEPTRLGVLKNNSRLNLTRETSSVAKGARSVSVASTNDTTLMKRGASAVPSVSGSVQDTTASSQAAPDSTTDKTWPAPSLDGSANVPYLRVPPAMTSMMGGFGVPSSQMNLMPFSYVPGFQIMPQAVAGTAGVSGLNQMPLYPGLYPGVVRAPDSGSHATQPTAVAPMALNAPSIPGTLSLGMAAVPSSSAVDINITRPPPIPPPGNQDARLQQNYEYYKYTFGNRRAGNTKYEGSGKNKRAQFR